MKKHIYRVLSVSLCLLMLTGILPAGLEMKADALSVKYCGTAAAQWAKDHWDDTDSVLYGAGYFKNNNVGDGGDCANFVSQCLYMGGLEQTPTWCYAGYRCHFTSNMGATWITAHSLYNYLVSLGGQSIQNPSPSDVSVGDVIFYKTTDDGRMHHSAIVIAIENGTPIIAAHSAMEGGSPKKYKTSDWHCNVSGERTFLVKLNGEVCYARNPRSFDVYATVKGSDATSTTLFKSTSLSSSKLAIFSGGYSTAGQDGALYTTYYPEYAHVYETKWVNGHLWGRTFRYNSSKKICWGWLDLSLNGFEYKTHVDSYRPSHDFGDWRVEKEANCLENGTEARTCRRCGLRQTRTTTGGHKVTVPAACLSASFCDVCGKKMQDALGHNFDVWKYVVTPTCLEGGSEKRECLRCGYTETRDVPALGHDYQPTASAPSCLQTGTQTYKCTRCGDSYIQPVDKDNPWSDWTTDKIDLPEGKVRSKIQYRYSDKKTTTSYEENLAGWTQDGGSWVQSDSGNYDFVYSFPDGYDTKNWLYVSLNKSPLTSYENNTNKRVVTINDTGVNIYWHWCEGKSDGSSVNYNRSIEYNATGTWTHFHAFQSSGDLPFNTSYKVFISAVDSNCPGSKYWYGKDRLVNNNLDIYKCSYTDYKKLFNYYQWTDWSDWQDEAVTATSTKKVETRTVYSYDLAALGHDWAPVKQDATCTEKGYEGNICRRCGARDIKDIAPLGHDMPDWEQNRDEWYKISKDGENPIVYRADCRRNCGYFETREESGCQYAVSKVVDPTCTKDGYTLYKCKVHENETKKDNIVPALGHEADNNWYTTKGATCTEAGEETCKCVRHDNGVTCDKLFTREVPAKGHKYVHFDMVDATCVDDGMKEYYKCSECKELFDSNKKSTTADKLVIPAKGHVPGDWVQVQAPTCGVPGYYVKRCTVCDTLLDEKWTESYEHNFEIIRQIDSTCISTGVIDYECTRCGYSYSDILDLTDHTWGKDEVKYATCTESGIKKHVCTYCGLEDILEGYDASGHAKSPNDEGYADSDDKMELISSVNNVCGSGKIETYQCTHIDKNTNLRCTYQVVIGNSKDHNLKEVITKQPTCTEPGSKHKECQNANCTYVTEDEIIQPTGHDYRKSETISPSCVTPGYTIEICANDSSHRRETNQTAPLGHDYDFDSSPKSNSDKTHS